MKDRAHQCWWSFQACLSGGNVGVIDEGKKLSMLSRFRWGEKDELTLASVYLKGENVTMEWDYSARIKDNRAGTWVREQGGSYRFGRKLGRPYSGSRQNICGRRKSPGLRLNFHKCSVFRAQRKEGEKPRVGTEIAPEERMCHLGSG